MRPVAAVSVMIMMRIVGIESSGMIVEHVAGEPPRIEDGLRAAVMSVELCNRARAIVR